jgi:hypothetical protein
MTDPISLTAVGTVTLLLTKGVEKFGENIAEEVWQKGKAFLALLKRKAPSHAEAIEKFVEQPMLAEQQPADYEIAVLVEQIESVTAQDPELQQAAQAVVDALKMQPGMIVNMRKLAEKIGLVVQGGTVHIDKFTF